MLNRFTFFVMLCLASMVTYAQDANIRIEGVGVDIWNVSARGTGEQPMHPLGKPPKFEDEPGERPGEEHYWISTRPQALRDLDYATTATDANYPGASMNRIVADASTTLTIAVPIDDLDAQGWSRTDTSFNSTLNDFYVYEYEYDTPNEYIDIPFNDEDAPTIVFAERGQMVFDSPRPISDLADGIVIDIAFDEYNRGDFVVDPHLLIMPNGDYIAGEKQRRHISTDKGQTWSRLVSNYGVEHASTFEHNGDLYIIGDENGNGDHTGAIARSTDGGTTFGDPVLLLDNFRNSPSQVIKSRGRIWIAYEDKFSKVVNLLSASESSDLMNPDSWVTTVRQDNNGTGNEADMTIGRDGFPVAIGKGGPIVRATSITEAVAEGEEIDIPVSGKFSVVYDETTDKWWSLTSYSPISGNVRTGITLYSSDDLVNWTFERTVIQGTSTRFHGFNYPFMLIDGDDIVFVLRTAWENEKGQAQRWHDGNFLSFHKVADFRGDVSSTCTLVPFANINSEEWNEVAEVSLDSGDAVRFGPQSERFGADQSEGWSWTGPNNFTASTREILLENVGASDAGTYTVTNTDSTGCTASIDFTVSVAGSGQTASEGTYYLQNVATGQYLDSDPDNVVLLSNPREGVDTRWNLAVSTEGFFFIDAAPEDRGPLTAKPSLNNTLTYLAERFNDSTFENREWQALPVGNNSYAFLCKDSARGYITAAGDGVQNRADGDDAAAHWQLVPASATASLKANITAPAVNINMHPNPTRGGFTVDLENIQVNSVDIFSVTGQKVHSETLVDHPSQLQINESLVPGMYLVRLTDSKGETITKKIVVE